MNTADSSNYELTIALGTELAASLASNDTLGRWMAHYIADLIRRADEAPDGPEREQLRQACATEILRLWSHRQSFGHNHRPMASFDAVYRALKRLDPEQLPWSYFRTFDRDPKVEAGSRTETLLAAAIAVENAARDTVRGLILSAAQAAAQKEVKWAQLARGIRDDEWALRQHFESLLQGNGGDEADESPDNKQTQTTIKAIKALAEATRRAQEAMNRSDAADERPDG